MKVRTLENKDQSELLKGEEYAKGKLFNPLEDADEEFVISETEYVEYLKVVSETGEDKFEFIKGLKQKEHNPKIENIN